jgi:hypothetical protein
MVLNIHKPADKVLLRQLRLLPHRLVECSGHSFCLHRLEDNLVRKIQIKLNKLKQKKKVN